ncbi:hypothetical protein [Brevibacillus laterosporus]|uniref:hypothetical protein n=1 Tax=Brevibacillus laterosporus TaxID=1465 RepID=UPI0018CD34D6|nr:hypothetical protein [Brevibacillus laterosporus]MBG9799519.1 hypothetical protein [Brevibacillus laterosporus]MED1909760.1 hypothetical protein [Brevibacillus laterosporus]
MDSIEMIKDHIRELDRDIDRARRSYKPEYDAHARLMQAKSDALRALVHAERTHFESLEISHGDTFIDAPTQHEEELDKELSPFERLIIRDRIREK